MQTYNKTTWEDYPSTKSPINAASLNNIENGIARNNAAINSIEGKLDAMFRVEDNVLYITTPTSAT